MNFLFQVALKWHAVYYGDNEKVLATLDMAFKLAEEFDQQGLADFIAGRLMFT
jgi:hypothetical protein